MNEKQGFTNVEVLFFYFVGKKLFLYFDAARREDYNEKVCLCRKEFEDDFI